MHFWKPGESLFKTTFKNNKKENVKKWGDSGLLHSTMCKGFDFTLFFAASNNEFLSKQHMYMFICGRLGKTFMITSWSCVPVDPDVWFESPIPRLTSNRIYLSRWVCRNDVGACCLMWADLLQSHCWGLKNLCQQKKIVQCLLPVLKGAHKECLGCLIVSHYSDGRLDQSPCLWDHYSVIRILVLLPDRVFWPDMCNMYHLQNWGYIIMFRKVIWSDQFISNESVDLLSSGFADIQWEPLMKELCNIHINMQPY